MRLVEALNEALLMSTRNICFRGEIRKILFECKKGALSGAMSLVEFIYSRLSLSRIPRDSLKYFEISVPRHIRFCRIEEKITRTTTFNKFMCNRTLEVKDILKILWKRGVSSFPQYFFTCCSGDLIRRTI